MSSRELAARMGVSQPALIQLEQSERAGRAQLNSLRKAAAALDCDLVYALVPRTSLENTLQVRAHVLARRAVTGRDRAQNQHETPEHDALALRIESYAAALLAGGRLWDDRDAG